MISDFSPIPEKGVKYITPHGDIYTVTDTLFNLGAIPDTVVYVSDNDSSLEFQDYAEDWNSKEFKLYIPDGDNQMNHQNSTDVDDTGVDVNVDTSDHNDQSTDSTGSLKKEKDNDGASSSIPHSSQIPSGLYSSDPQINELVGLLESGPNLFNQNYFPTDKDLSDNNMVEKDVEDAFQKTLDEITDLRTEGKQKQASFLNEFLWTCGGLDKELLRMCPIDWAKKAGMGGTILGTALLATLSMGFAAFSISSIATDKSWLSILIAIFIGIIWGLVIFNLDRYLVNSMYSDGESTISWQEFKSGLPRIIIAIFLGIVISTPLEMLILQSKIQENITATDTPKLGQKALLEASPELLSVNNELNRQQKLVDDLYADWRTKDSLYNVEHTKGQNGSVAGYGPKAKQLEKDANDAKELYNNAKIQRDTIKLQYDSIFGLTVTSQKSEITMEQGFARRLESLFEITSWKDGKNSLFWVRIMIMLMFVTLEVLPVFNKMMQQDGKYDKLIDLESDTMDKLARIKEFNNINIIKTGHLAPHLTQIIGRKIVEDDNEGNNPYLKQDRRKENKDETDAVNQEIYRKALKEAKEYIMARIEGIFPENSFRMSPPSIAQNKPSVLVGKPISPKDASDEAETI